MKIECIDIERAEELLNSVLGIGDIRGFSKVSQAEFSTISEHIQNTINVIGDSLNNSDSFLSFDKFDEGKEFDFTVKECIKLWGKDYKNILKIYSDDDSLGIIRILY